MLLTPGSTLRSYKIIKPLGAGGMGEVYLAEDTKLGRQVAIKLMDPLLGREPGFLSRFDNEARIQAKLVHQHIVILHEYFTEGEANYMVLEYAPGITLRKLIDQTGPIPEERTLHIFRQLAEALAYSHSKGIIHRDVKPTNIMVDPDHDYHVKVMDFGIARLLNSGHLTHSGTRLGTVYYMSPEQVQAKKDIDQRTDIYSAGVVLYEMLSGELPFDLDTDSDLLIPSRILNDPLPDPRIVYGAVSQSTINMLNRLTIKDRDDRPDNLLEELTRRDKEFVAAKTPDHPKTDNNQRKKADKKAVTTQKKPSTDGTSSENEKTVQDSYKQKVESFGYFRVGPGRWILFNVILVLGAILFFLFGDQLFISDHLNFLFIGFIFLIVVLLASLLAKITSKASTRRFRKGAYKSSYRLISFSSFLSKLVAVINRALIIVMVVGVVVFLIIINRQD